MSPYSSSSSNTPAVVLYLSYRSFSSSDTLTKSEAPPTKREIPPTNSEASPTETETTTTETETRPAINEAPPTSEGFCVMSVEESKGETPPTKPEISRLLRVCKPLLNDLSRKTRRGETNEEKSRDQSSCMFLYSTRYQVPKASDAPGVIRSPELLPGSPSLRPPQFTSWNLNPPPPRPPPLRPPLPPSFTLSIVFARGKKYPAGWNDGHYSLGRRLELCRLGFDGFEGCPRRPVRRGQRR